MIFFSYFSVFAQETCKYSAQIEQCKTATNPRTISEFICPEDNTNLSKVIPQIILDIEFKKIDTEAELYIDFLERNKDFYFWPKAKKTYPEAIDDIWQKFELNWYFWKKYMNWCLPNAGTSIVQESLSCSEWAFDIASISNFFNETLCFQMVTTKLEMYRDVSFQVLKLNKNQIQKDTYKTVMQDQRWKYDRLIDIINLNLSFIERIWARLPYFVKDAFGS